MPDRPEAKDTPLGVTQIAAAMAALGLYGGANTPADSPPAARLIHSPYDPEARFGCKRDVTWVTRST